MSGRGWFVRLRPAPEVSQALLREVAALRAQNEPPGPSHGPGGRPQSRASPNRRRRILSESLGFLTGGGERYLFFLRMKFGVLQKYLLIFALPYFSLAPRTDRLFGSWVPACSCGVSNKPFSDLNYHFPPCNNPFGNLHEDGNVGWPPSEEQIWDLRPTDRPPPRNCTLRTFSHFRGWEWEGIRCWLLANLVRGQFFFRVLRRDSAFDSSKSYRAPALLI